MSTSANTELTSWICLLQTKAPAPSHVSPFSLFVDLLVAQPVCWSVTALRENSPLIENVWDVLWKWPLEQISSWVSDPPTVLHLYRPPPTKPWHLVSLWGTIEFHFRMSYLPKLRNSVFSSLSRVLKAINIKVWWILWIWNIHYFGFWRDISEKVWVIVMSRHAWRMMGIRTCLW